MAPSILSIVKRDAAVNEEQQTLLTTLASNVIQSPEEKVEDIANAAVVPSGGAIANNVADKNVQQIVANTTEKGMKN